MPVDSFLRIEWQSIQHAHLSRVLLFVFFVEKYLIRLIVPVEFLNALVELLRAISSGEPYDLQIYIMY